VRVKGHLSARTFKPNFLTEANDGNEVALYAAPGTANKVGLFEVPSLRHVSSAQDVVDVRRISLLIRVDVFSERLRAA
jgi:hypothetical protein